MLTSKQQGNSGYIIVYDWMMALRGSTREVYALLYGYRNEAGEVRLSMSYVAKRLHISSGSVRLALRQLVERGLVKQMRCGDGAETSTYHIAHPDEVGGIKNIPLQKIEGYKNYTPRGTKNIPQGYKKYTPYNNIILNNNKHRDIEADPEFEKFWDGYDKKVERVAAERMWKRLTKSQRAEVMKRYPAYVASRPDKKYRLNPASYLNPDKKRWLDEVYISSSTKQHETDRIEQARRAAEAGMDIADTEASAEWR